MHRPFGATNSADPLKCPPETNSSLLLTPSVPPTVLPSMPASFGALQVAWVEDELKLFGCRDKLFPRLFASRYADSRFQLKPDQR